jgi:hypothetical protein
MRRLCIGAVMSMVVLMVHEYRVLTFEAERDSPVAANGHGPVALELASQRMQPQTGQVDVLRRGRGASRPSTNRNRAACSGRIPTVS